MGAGKQVAKGALVDDFGLGFNDWLEGVVVDSSVHLHAAGIDHGHIERIVIVDKMIKHCSDSEQLQGVDTDEGNVEAECQPLGF